MSSRPGLESVEFPDNPEPRCACVLLLDVSSSMSGAPIDALNEGIRSFKNNVGADDLASLRVEVAIATFSSDVQIVQDFVTVDDFDPPTLTAYGQTRMGAGISEALDMVERRKQDYRSNGISYYRPWVFMITDGAPTDDVTGASARLKQDHVDKRVAFFSVGVKGADMQRLKEIGPADREPLLLDGLRFNDLFEWLSQSMSAVSRSQTDAEQIALPAVGWAVV